MSAAEKVTRFGRGLGGHVGHILVCLLGIVVGVVRRDYCVVVVGWRAARAGMKWDSQCKGRSSYSLRLLQVTLQAACRWGDSDAESPSSTADGRIVSGWAVME